jgi:hypothetical protein
MKIAAFRGEMKKMITKSPIHTSTPPVRRTSLLNVLPFREKSQAGERTGYIHGEWSFWEEFQPEG